MVEFKIYNSDYENDKECRYNTVYADLSIGQAKRIASLKLKWTTKTCQMFTYKTDNDKKIIFRRTNKICPNNEIIYGKWN